MLSYYEHEDKVKNHTEAEFLGLHFFLLKTNFFRYEQVNHSESLLNYRKTL